MAATLMTLLTRLGLDAGDFHKGLAEATKATDITAGSIVKSLGKIGVVVGAAGIGAAVAGVSALGTAGLLAGKQLEDATGTIITATGASGKELDALVASARNVGREVPQGVGAAGEAVSMLNVLLGISGEELDGASKAALDFARVNKAEVSTVANMVGRGLNALGLSADQAVPFMDKLTKAAQLSGMSAIELGEAVIAAGPAFAELGFETDRAIGLFASFAKAGADPREIISSISLALNTLVKSQEEANEVTVGGVKSMVESEKQLAKLKEQLQLATMRQAEFTDKTKASSRAASEMQIQNLTRDIQELEAAMAKGEFRTIKTAQATMTAQEAFEKYIADIRDAPNYLDSIRIANELFGARVGGKIADDIRAGRFEVQEWEAILAESGGTLDDVAKRTLTFGDRLGIMKNKAADALAPIGMMFLDLGEKVLDKLMPHIGPLVESFSQRLAPAIQAVADAAAKLLEGDVRGALTALFGSEMAGQITAFAGTVSGFVNNTLIPFVSEHAEELKGALAGIATALGVAAVAAGVMAISVSPITLAVLAIIAVAALLGAAWAGNWGGIQEKTQAVIDWLTPYVQGALAAIQGWWAEHGEQVLATVAALWQTVQGIFESVMAVVGPAVSTFIEGVKGGFANIGPLVEALKGLWESLQPVFEAVGVAIGAIIALLAGVILGMFNGIAAAIGPFIDGIVTVATGVITALSGVIDFVTGFVSLILGLFTGNSEAVQNALSKMGEGIEKIWNGIVSAVTSLISGLINTITSFISGFVDGIVKFFKGLYDTLVGHSIIPDLVRDIIKTFTQVDWLQLGKDIINGVVNGIRGAAGFLADAAGDVARAALDAAKGFLGIHSPSSVAAKLIGAPFVQGIGAGMQTAMASLARRELPAITAQLVSQPAAAAAGPAPASEVHNHYEIAAHYRNYQSEADLRDTIRALQMAGA